MDWKYIIVNECGGDIAEAAAYFTAFTDDELTAASNKGTLKRAIKDLEGGEIRVVFSGEFPEKGKAEIEVSDGRVTAGKNMGDYICSCPSKTVCRHIIAAAMVMRRIIEDNPAAAGEGTPVNEKIAENAQANEAQIPNKGGAEENPPKKSPEINADYINEVIRTCGGILQKGIIGCGKFEQEAMMSLSLKGGKEYGRLSNMCRTVSAGIEAMNSRSPAFEPLGLSLLLGRIINTSKVIMGEKRAELLESEGYTERGDGYFIGLGAYPYRTKTGFAGITVLLYEKRLNEYFTYGCGISDIYEKTADAASEKSFQKQLDRHCHWANEVSLASVSGNSFRLIGFKADVKNRISSSKYTNCIILGKVSSDVLPEEVFAVQPAQEYDYFRGSGRERFFVREIKSVEDVRFDRTAQELHFTAVSPKGEGIAAALPHSAVNERAERFIEELSGRDMSGYVMVFGIHRNGIIPVSLIGRGGVTNFYFK